MRAVVTGAAGFIGSTLVEALLAQGDAVVGVDAFTSYYDPARKRANLREVATGHPRFELVEADVRTTDLVSLLEDADAVFHLSAQAGVRHSWAEGFEEYASHNVLATQRLLEACIRTRIPRVVYASSSSVYGQAPRYPTTEDDLPAPHSPYGVTKLAGEHLCGLYAANWGVPAVALRYFTVYGPRQRPDMAVHRLLEAGLTGTRFPLNGDGSAVRDLTFVDDVVAANLRAAAADVEPGTVVNIAGGAEVSMQALLELAAGAVGAEIAVEHRPAAVGDVDRTGGATDRAHRLLGWEPTVGIAEGLARQAAWHRRNGAGGAPAD